MAPSGGVAEALDTPVLGSCPEPHAWAHQQDFVVQVNDVLVGAIGLGIADQMLVADIVGDDYPVRGREGVKWFLVPGSWFLVLG